MSARTPAHWQSKNPLAIALWPVSVFFGLLVWCRRIAYRAGLFKRFKTDVPVIVVGNITAGGAGKTPLVIALARHLQSQGIDVGILCGGYGGTARGGAPMLVNSHSDAAVAGDEAVLIARQTDLPVVVSKDRAAGARRLQSILCVPGQTNGLSKPACIVCDDGLQHYRLVRDIEVIVVSAAHRFGNAYMLPAGPLREPLSRLQSADLVCYSGDDHPAPGYTLEPGVLVNVQSGEPTTLALFTHRRIRAVAGIAYPDQFFNTLRSMGFEVEENALPDHHHFDQGTLQFDDKLPIIMTEKDSVKCLDFAPPHAWYLTAVAVPDELLQQQFDSWTQIVKERLS